MNRFGKIVWLDLTVDNAEQVKDFYSHVVGWTATDLSMGDYKDYLIAPAPDEEPTAGICHSRGPNANMPPQWLTYVVVDNVDKCIDTCKALGGQLLDGPRMMGKSRCIVIQDPAGAVLALIEE